MSQLTDRLERDLREIAAGAHPSPSAWESIVARLGDDGESEVALVLAPAPDRSRRHVWIKAVAAASLVVITGSIAVLVTRAGDDHSISTADPDATTNPPVVPPSTVTDVVPTIPPTAAPFVGIWVSTDSDGSYPTMEIIGSGGDDYEFVLGDFATACDGPATMTGIGLLETDERLVIAQPELTCEDGTIPGIGPPPQAELANFTLDLDTATDELVDSLGVVWQRDLPNLTTTFVSPRNGFSINHPDTEVALTPANDRWDPWNVFTDRGVDVLETRFAVFKGASTELIDEYLDDNVLPDGCGVPRSQQAEITIDGLSGRISECPNKIEATVVAGGRLYLFTLLHDRSDARAVFDAFAATIDLIPETAVDFPNLTATFVSPTNGYSFGYIYRGVLAPATELWDPVIDPPADNSGTHDDPFDGVETGLAAYFKGASTAIPDGVSIDEYLDDNVSPSGCGVPRSQQPEITIDGQSGRIAECPNLIEATVVAGGRLYLFMLLHERSDARAFFDAWVATIDLTPETAA